MDKRWRLPPMDEAKRIAVIAVLERVERQTAEENKEQHERLTASAIAMGFSSWEEQKQHDWDDRLRREAEHQRRLPEIAAAAGKTVEEYRRELYSNKDFIPPSPVPSFSNCDCEEHPSIWFCPAVLVEYRSQDRPDFWDYEELNRSRIETLRIEPDEKSRRLNSKTLEKAWDMLGPTTLPLPIWAMANPEILAVPRAEITTPLCTSNLGQNAPSLSSPSLGLNSSPATSVATPRSPSNDSDHRVRSEPLKSHQPTARRAPLTAYEKCHITKIVKNPRPTARKTRSHKINLFYEFDRTGHLVPFRGF